ncbi:MAG: DUF3857 domain-containing protein [Steroidobacteraceae bacterium]
MVIQRLAGCLLAGLLPFSAAAASAWSVAPREGWVQDPPAGTTLPWHDRQIRVTAAGDERYEHTLLPLTADQVTEDASQLSLGLDPRFQLLVIHALKLTRAAGSAQVFNAAQIRQLVRTQPAEADPHKNELNPQLLFSLQVPGAQPGDVLEFEYTVQSLAARFPGVIAGHYAAQWPSGAGLPLHWERLRVLWPAGRALQYRLIRGVAGAAPQIQSRAGELDIQWRDLVPAAAEPDTPRWFTRQDLVQLSDFADWNQVATQLAPLYDATSAVVQQPPGAAATPAMILGALRLVQTKVHAMNLSGSGPYVPADPATLLQRGFGDGRDLARLLVSLLRRLGVDAQVALADSHRGALLEESLPSPYVLDSALVLVRAGTQRYWLNPAAAGPATDLSTTDTADLQHALLIGTDGQVVPLPPPQPESRLRSVLQQFDLRAGNLRPAMLSVTTRFHGSWAQAARQELRAQSQAQLQLAQIQSVAQDYPDASAVGDVQLEDLADGQTVQLTARFRLARPFGDGRDPHFSFFAEGLAEVVQPRDEATRRQPLSLPWPLKLDEHIVASLPPDLRVLAGTTVVENPAFRYQREVRFSPGRVEITHSYLVRSDHVDPADYPRYLAANAQVYQLLGLRVLAHTAAWRRPLDWLGDYWLRSTVIAAVVGALTLALWRRMRRA